jgi:peroxiredoxin Q/BCP
MRKLVFLAVSFISNMLYAGPQVGELAPDFRLRASDGKTYTLSEFNQEKFVVIAFFPKAFTGGWTAECKALRDSDKQIRNFDVAYFMASTDSLENNTGFAEKNQATFPILADSAREMSQAYGVLTPVGFARRWTFYIDDTGIIRKIDKRVDVRRAGEQLVSNMEALGFPKSAHWNLLRFPCPWLIRLKFIFAPD